MDSVVDWGPVDVRWSGLARALGLGPLGGLVVDVLGRKGSIGNSDTGSARSEGRSDSNKSKEEEDRFHHRACVIFVT